MPGLNPVIMTADMAGGRMTVLVHTAVSYVDSIVINTAEQRVYWTDYDRQSVESVSYMHANVGLNRKVFLKLPGYGINAIALSRVCIYSFMFYSKN